MKLKSIKKLVSVIVCSAIAMLSLTGCGEIEVLMTSNTAVNSKTTTNGVMEYNGAYYIVDKNGINYKRTITDENSVVVAHSSKANGNVQDNFAIGDGKIYFVTNAVQEGNGKTLYQCELDGKKRKKIIVRDEITIVGVFNNAVYFYDEQNFLKCIEAKTSSKTEISSAYGAPFFQYNNCFIHKASDGILEAYNCDDDDTQLLSEEKISVFNGTSTGVAYAVNSSTTKGSYEYKFSLFNYTDMAIKPMHKLSTDKPVDVITETVALSNLKNGLRVCSIDSGKVEDYSYAKQGKILYDTAVSKNAYYINDNTCLKFNPNNSDMQKLNANYKKNKVDYNKVKAIVLDKYVVSIDKEGYCAVDKLA
ncbi:MAG: hypothetical protein UD936_04425 [Acutalibacteraceae bacterium]|nr:hypothetical protein [Acutalibacteraceae bacterium]